MLVKYEIRERLKGKILNGIPLLVLHTGTDFTYISIRNKDIMI